MLGPIIYKKDNSGNLRQWNYETQGDRWCSHTGMTGGTVTQSGWTTCVPRSRPTAEEQALFEAEAEMGKKLARDYSTTKEGVEDEREFGGDVMLANKYEKFTSTTTHFSQPKLDGMRCKINRHGMWTRKGKPIVSCPHIFAILAPAFPLQPDLELDGELYNHEMKSDFNGLMSILRKTKPTEEDIQNAAKLVQYHVYDICREDRTFQERSRTLEMFVMNLQAPEIVFVPTAEVNSVEQLDQAYGSYLHDGYEGQIVRLNGPYERKRSKLLLKRKQFETREFELVSIEEGNGNWTGLAKRVTFRLPDGRLCGGGIRGNAERAKHLLLHRNEYIGRLVTIRYFATNSVDQDGSADKNLPRFPVAIDFNREE